MLKILILFKKIKENTNTRKKSCIIHGKNKRLCSVGRVRVSDTRTRLKYADFSGLHGHIIIIYVDILPNTYLICQLFQ